MEEPPPQLPPPPPRVCTVLDVAKLARSMRAKLWDFDGRRQPPSIYKVIPSVRMEDHPAYDPHLVSIGPFHRETSGLSASEDLKWQYLHDLLDRRPETDRRDRRLETHLQYTISRIGVRLEDIRGQYSEGFPGITDDAFVKMMVLDGCFILELMIKLRQHIMRTEMHGAGEREGVIEEPGAIYRSLSFAGGKWSLPHLLIDLFLLENQIPFFVLEILFDAMAVMTLENIFLLENHHPFEGPLPRPLTLPELIYYTLVNAAEMPPPELNRTFLHLVHLHHFAHVLWSTREEPSSFSCWWSACQVLRKMRKVAFKVVLLILLRLFFLVVALLFCRVPDNTSSKRPPLPWYIPSATKLKEAGVRFKRKDFAHPLRTLTVTFPDEQGIIEISFLLLHGGSNSFLRNMIAFEECCHIHGIENYFASYCGFMACLMDKDSDVDILEEDGIICNFMGNSSEVATLFDRVIRGSSLEISKYTELTESVNKYCESEIHRWRARLIRDYFSNPWAVISLIGAVVLLVLTIVQTTYTVRSYYKS